MCWADTRPCVSYHDEALEKGVLSLIKHLPGNKILIDQFLDRCQEAEIDAIFDGEDFSCDGCDGTYRPAGLHSGDSMRCFHIQSLSAHRAPRWKVCRKNCTDIKNKGSHHIFNSPSQTETVFGDRSKIQGRVAPHRSSPTLTRYLILIIRHPRS